MSISCVIRELLSDDYSETYYHDDGTPVTTTPTNIVNRRSYTSTVYPTLSGVTIYGPLSHEGVFRAVDQCPNKGFMCYCSSNTRTTATTRAEWSTTANQRSASVHVAASGDHPPVSSQHTHTHTHTHTHARARAHAHAHAHARTRHGRLANDSVTTNSQNDSQNKRTDSFSNKSKKTSK